MGDVETLVALQADEVGAQATRQHLGHLRLANASLTLEQERALQLQRQIDGGGEAAVGNVELFSEELLQLLDGAGRRWRHGHTHQRMEWVAPRGLL